MVVATDRSTGCSTTASTVVNSGIVPVEFTATADVSAILDAHRIETNLISAAGDDSRFQVRLDDGIWYDMNTSSSGFFYNFDNVETGNGIHQVYFRDAVGCFSDQREVLLIGVPQFFTPNDDGYNDRWNVFGATGLLEDSRLFIFDRYGKLLLQLQTSTSGWDGTFNGEPLPSTDYWFTLELNGGQIVKGYFAMKR
jgi:gliding motility-associated-like protein